ncbi:hypothetical protein AA23498_0052 [Acetobacter nitrogenifigens DSM 23921 = NBRC 105050]|uniref:Uncharacterized protein n=1 Tax=Acetobacter nitrogenifigens DSM 23921 = NBRC 105050 TaxID=1120919 RepID=A0A511X904_9PROT|nr:hypothetical protein AA23498_0052 [Acetobacter nitrogenifigens DSM 23921 = NBRC 105050]GEN59435.1 hypothetical protein ANI02nite_13190 [Acetobacter nitrogenifigens DSM 23921 = NBRC 105050]
MKMGRPQRITAEAQSKHGARANLRAIIAFARIISVRPRKVATFRSLQISPSDITPMRLRSDTGAMQSSATSIRATAEA